ncbi:MAG TPA: NAD(P)/FAD-dependent oxidoreductase [Acidimicrobiales bacterium]|nr:NAD(P)/FAD-dependent oxidoreductase [Acidimicrobiales bacterium]
MQDRVESGVDVLIVGSGPGGLVAAAYLAAAGRRVLVLEHHDVAGGNCTVFRRGPLEFDVGVHYLGDCGPGGVIPSLLSGLGLADRIRFLPLEPDGFDELRFPGLEFRVPADRAEYTRRLVEAFPAEAAAVTECMDLLGAIAEEARMANIPGTETPLLDRWRDRPLDELFDHCGLSPRAAAVLDHWSGLYGSGPSRSNVPMHAGIIDHYMRGAYYPEGGGQVIAARLVEVIEALGGEVRTRARVDRILVEDGQVKGVRLSDGEVISAPVVVSNADYKRTVLELVGAEHWRAGTVARAESARMSLALACVYVTVAKDLVTDQPNCNYFIFPSWDVEGAYSSLEAGELPEGELPFAYVSIASRKDPGNPHLCPPGHTNFQIMTLVPRGYGWWGVEKGPATGARYRRNPEYRRAKEKLTTMLLEAAESVLGEFHDEITHIEMATPVTHERYTLSTGGTSYGLAHSPEQTGANRPDHRTEIAGLYLAGANTRTAHGIAGAMLGGVTAAGRILDRPLLIEAMMGGVLVDPGLLPADGPDWDPLEVSRGAALRARRTRA